MNTRADKMLIITYNKLYTPLKMYIDIGWSNIEIKQKKTVKENSNTTTTVGRREDTQNTQSLTINHD